MCRRLVESTPGRNLDLARPAKDWQSASPPFRPLRPQISYMRARRMVGVTLFGWLAGCGGGSEQAVGHETVSDAALDGLFALAHDGASAVARDGSSGIAHVFVVAMENESIGQIYGDMTDAPYINGTLIPTGARATSFPSQCSASRTTFGWKPALTPSPTTPSRPTPLLPRPTARPAPRISLRRSVTRA